MSKKRLSNFNKPSVKTGESRFLSKPGSIFKKNAEELADSNRESSSSFIYDVIESGIKSTQQIPVDFSKFSNHTFFSSAEVNTNIAFEKIINKYPFNGTKKEYEKYIESLTGFEKWVLSQFPTNTGYLFFSGSSSTSPNEGTYIKVKDFSGLEVPSLADENSGKQILDSGENPLSFEFHLFVPQEANGNQVICQKLSGSRNGITLALSESSSTTNCDLFFGISSGSRDLFITSSLTKGEFNHIVATFDRGDENNLARIFLNSNVSAESDKRIEIGNIDYNLSEFIIGSGTTHNSILDNNLSFVPNETLSGALDEFRVFHSVRTIAQQKLLGKKNIFADDNLKLYFRFNEPTGSINDNPLVLDYSNSSLHSHITNFSHSLRSTGSIISPMEHEKKELNPVLFPAFDDVLTLNERLLFTASQYDDLNPNLITKLVPPHYLDDGQAFEGFNIIQGTIVDEIDSNDSFRNLNIGSTQLLSTFLFIWAKFFDEIKMVLDLFSKTIHVDYDKIGTTADQFLPFVAKWYGFEMPAFFKDSSIEQFIDAENIGHDISNNDLSLRYIQNQIWRRILTNIGDVIRSKGTLHSVKSLFRSIGIDPDKNFRIREYGGSSKFTLGDHRENRSAIKSFLNFSGSLATFSDPETVNALGVHSSNPYMESPYLSGSRVEIGFPDIQGSYVDKPNNHPHGISDNVSDGLFTSGSWTIESQYRWPNILTGSHFQSQSLMRIESTGSSGVSLISNLVVESGSNLTLFVSPDVSTSRILKLELTGANIMDGKLWNISYGRKRNDQFDSHFSSSYFVRASHANFGEILQENVTSSLFYEGESSQNVLQNITSSLNASGSFLIVGSQSINTSISSLLNDTTNAPALSRMTTFSGLMGQTRFWSKFLELDEWREHCRNPTSVGVLDPEINFNFSTTQTGSFEKLRIDASIDQPMSMSGEDGGFQMFDFSQNDLHFTGSGFENSKIVLNYDEVFYSHLSPKFDELSSNNKVRIRGFQDFHNVELLGGEVSPVYNIPQSEKPSDDTRFSIDFSIMDSLNEDIVKIMSTLDIFDNILGDPELIFSPDYPSLENLSEVYFNRLDGKIRMRKFFEFFKWFDSILNISAMVEQLLPRKTNYKGSNFVVESHILERSKYEHKTSDIYLGEDLRRDQKTILLQQLNAKLKRF